MDIGEKSNLIKSWAKDLGFMLCGFSKAQSLNDEGDRLKIWLDRGYHGDMIYMTNHFDMRTDPTLLLPGAKSVISLAYNYFHTDKPIDPKSPKIAMYAYGKDYHKVVRKKLNELLSKINLEFSNVNGRVFVDSAPILERDWAKYSGLGWIGKNTLLIHPKKGSYFFLAEIIIDVELIYDSALTDHCGTCTRCIDACPTQAIAQDGYYMDGSKCISYLTIELKDEDIPAAFIGKMDNWMFGCDICQQVCPWNRFSTDHDEAQFKPKDDLLTMSHHDWKNLSETDFNDLFEGSAIKRTKYSGLKRNIAFLDKKE